MGSGTWRAMNSLWCSMCGGDAEVAPVGGDGADAVGADGDDLLDFLRGEGCEAGFGEGLEDQVVAQAAGGVAGALFFRRTPKVVPRWSMMRAKSAMISRPWGS